MPIYDKCNQKSSHFKAFHIPTWHCSQKKTASLPNYAAYRTCLQKSHTPKTSQSNKNFPSLRLKSNLINLKI